MCVRLCARCVSRQIHHTVDDPPSPPLQELSLFPLIRLASCLGPLPLPTSFVPAGASPGRVVTLLPPPPHSPFHFFSRGKRVFSSLLFRLFFSTGSPSRLRPPFDSYHSRSVRCPLAWCTAPPRAPPFPPPPSPAAPLLRPHPHAPPPLSLVSLPRPAPAAPPPPVPVPLLMLRVPGWLGSEGAQTHTHAEGAGPPAHGAARTSRDKRSKQTRANALNAQHNSERSTQATAWHGRVFLLAVHAHAAAERESSLSAMRCCG